MNPCESFQARLIHHLYGLLEDDDQKALAAHLETCADCRAALASLEDKRLLLAAAAKAEFPEVQFKAPADRTPAPRPQTLPLERPRPVRRARLRWAVAASVLLAGGLAGAWAGAQYAELRKEVNQAKEHEQELARERDQLAQKTRDKERANQKRLREIQEEIQSLDRERKRSRLQVRVTGPETIEAGARNQFLVHTENLVQEPVPARVDVCVRDQASRKVVFEQKGLRSVQGKCLFVLPPDLKEKPGTQLALEVGVAGDNGADAHLKTELPLVAPLYLTHLTTDKPMYQPGETVFFRSLTLERFSLKPVSQPLQITYRITSPTGAQVFFTQGASQLRYGPEKNHGIVFGPDGQPIHGVGVGSFPIAANAPGGVYTLSVSVSDHTGRPSLAQEQRRTFLVNKYQKPRLNKELEFTRKSYGPGDEVVAACRVARVEGGKPLAGQQVTADVRVDGRTYDAAGKPVNGHASGITLRTDAGGAVNVRFRLPARIERGDASLSLQFTDGANNETMVRPVPLVLKKLDVEFFPEGGDLVAGARNRVYFQVRTPRGKPAELKGRVVDAEGREVAKVETLNDPKEPGANQGMGAFDLDKPTAGAKYELKIDSPSGIEGRYELPAVKADGVVLHVPGGVVTDEVPVVLRNGKTKRSLLVGAYCRGRLMDHTTLTVEPGAEARVNLKPQAGVAGVYRVTVFEELGQGKERLKPAAERLVYRKPTERVNLTVKSDKGRYVPGERVRLTLSATDEKNKPLPAILMVSVVDKSVLTLADEKTARAMPTHFYLMTEVRGPEDLEHADFLLRDGPLAARALDLLLGTQGWRRFAEQQDPDAFQKKQAKDAERLVLVSGRKAQPKAVLAQPEVLPANDKFQPKIAKLQASIPGVIQQNQQLQQDQWQQSAAAQIRINRAAGTTRAAEVKLDEYWVKVRQAGLLVLVGLLGIAGICALVVGLRRVSRGDEHAVPYYAAGLGALVIFVVAGIYAVSSVLNERGRPGAAHDMLAVNQRADRGAAMWDKAAAEGMNKADLGPGQGGGAGGMPLPAAAPAPGLAVPRPAERLEMDEKGGKPGGFRGNRALRDRDVDALRKDAELGDDQKKELAEKPAPPRANQPAFPEKPRNGLLADAEQARQKEAGKRAWRGKDRLAAGPFVVREYAHRYQPARDNVRTDFAETLYWHPVLVLTGGKAEATFYLCDSVTTFQILACAHTVDGRLGSVTTQIESRLPFTIEPKVPIEVTSSDVLTIPLSLTNATDTRRAVKVQVEADGLKQTGPAAEHLTVDADKSVRRLFHFQPALVEGQARVRFKGQCEPFAVDQVERSFAVVPEGFPITGSHSDLLEQVVRRDVTLPATWVRGTLKLQAQVYPSTLADLQKGLESLLREPGGCFEQSSTSNYPNVLILDYLKESDQTNPELVRRCRQLLDNGYQRLTSFECLDPKQKKKGYEWFGGTAPAHEALTAYGLLQFRDMARVYPVDKTMLERTRKYLMAQRDGQGGFKRNPRALDTFGGAPPHITNAYIVWALTESGKEDDVSKELAALAGQAKTSDDPYFLALVANSLINRDQAAEGLDLLKKLVKAQKDDGHLDGKETSITRSGGRELQIETTALTVLAWLKAGKPEFTQPLQKAVKWIGQQRGGFGGFGSTQSTILALKALIAFTKANKKTAEAGELVLFVGDREVARRAFPAGAQDVLTVALPDADKVLRPGLNKVRVEMTGKNVFPYTLSWSYRTLQPANAADCPVRLTTKLDRTTATEAETVRLTAVVENTSGQNQGMALAVIGLPGGLTVPEDMKQIKELVHPRDKDVKSGATQSYLSSFEIRGRELVLYWRDLAKGEKVEVGLDLICRVPGAYSGPASRAYLYYNADKKFWYEPLKVTIKAKQ